MEHPRRYAVALLATALVLAVGTPLYSAYAAPYLSGYLLHSAVLSLQAVPFIVCAAIWLPWRARAASIAALTIAGLAFAAALVLYLPVIWRPERQGGDMVGLWYVLISMAMTGGVLIASAIAALALWLRGRWGAP